jgi:hypothetical protein
MTMKKTTMKTITISRQNLHIGAKLREHVGRDGRRMITFPDGRTLPVVDATEPLRVRFKR